MTLRDLVKKFYEGRAPGLWSESDKDIKGMRLVVQTLRDHFHKKTGTWEPRWPQVEVNILFDEILGSDAGNEKVAGGSTREDEKAVEAAGDKGPVSVNSPATDPAPAVCVWTASSASGLFSARCQPHNSFVRPVDNCHLCGLPIKFTEAK